jgi:hypothetical protein
LRRYDMRHVMLDGGGDQMAAAPGVTRINTRA